MIHVDDSLSNQIANRIFIESDIDAHKLDIEEYPAWTISYNGLAGVIVPYSGEEINEDFNKVVLKTLCPSIFGLEERTYLALLTAKESASKPVFATICENFVTPGKNGFYREQLLSDPVKWWASWRDFIGNSSSDHPVYSVIAEMIVLLYLKLKGIDVMWEGPTSGSHDITSAKVDFEVKSSLSRYDYKIHIAGEHQLKITEGKKLQLYFCRCEESFGGFSIGDLVDALVRAGFERDYILGNLKQLGIKQGNHLFKAKYDVIEMASFDVDSTFPMITNKSFKNDVTPKGISNISYMVDLLVADRTNHNIPKIR